MIRGNTIGFPNPQSNLEQTDPSMADYVFGKEAFSDLIRGKIVKSWSQVLTADTDTLLCAVYPSSTSGVFLMNIVYSANNVSVSDEYIISMSHGSVNITKIVTGGFGTANTRTIKAWASNKAYGGNGGGIIVTFNPSLQNVTQVTANCSYVPLTANIEFLRYEAGETSIPNGYTEYKSLQTINGKGLIDANFIADTTHTGCFYRLVDGKKEWINPPMAYGTEYLTTERCNSKAVYAQAISLGAMPNTSTKTIATGLAGISVASFDGFVINASGTVYEFPYTNSSGLCAYSYFSSDGTLGVKTLMDASGCTAYFVLKYTKD